MKLAKRIFKRSDYTITGNFGYRSVISSSRRTTSTFHSGTDYGTNGEKWAQYAVESGNVTSIFIDSYGAKCVWIEYPRLGIKLLHGHLNSISVSEGQSVDNNTIIGYTGKTGNATGIHLHLSMKNIGGFSYLDPEKYDYVEGTTSQTTDNILGLRGYIKLGDQSDFIADLSSFMYKTFPAYTSKKALGNYYGKYIQASIKEFQKRTNLESDGCVGPITLAKLKEYGL